MMKFLSGGLVFAGMVSAPAAISTLQHVSLGPTVSEHRSDDRLAAVRDFLGQYDCPAAENAETFLEAADDYELDWRLLPSLSFVESTGGKAARNNNIFGWNNGRASFASVEAGIHTVGYHLAHSRAYRNKDLNGILWAYNPRNGYAEKVKSVMRQISPSE
jgi:hypothetical protein